MVKPPHLDPDGRLRAIGPGRRLGEVAMNRTISLKNLLIALTITTLALAAWLAHTAIKLKAEAEERFFDQYNRQQLIVADHTAQAILDLFGTLRRSLTLTAQLYSDKPVTRETSLAAAGSLRAIYNVIGDTPIIDLVIFDREGTCVGIVPEEPRTIGVNYSWRGYYKWARDEGKPGVMYLSPFLKLQGGQNRGDMAIMVAEGIYGPGGEFKGVAMITLNFDKLVSRYILSVKMGEQGYAWLVDSANGSILVDPKGRIAGQTFEQAFVPKWPKLYELVKETGKGARGLSWYDFEDPSDQTRTVRKLVAYSPVAVENFLWTVGVCTPEGEVKQLFASFLGRQQSFFSTVILFTLTGAIFFLSILLLWNRALVKEVSIRTGALEAAQGKLETAFNELLGARKLAAVGHLALGLVHEIRNPLSSIRMNMQMIRKRLPPDGPSSENFRIMEDEILRLNRLLGDVMVFARPAPLRLSLADLTQLVRRVFILVGEKLNSADITTESVFGEGAVQVLCDQEQIMQLILNLVLNSIQALEGISGERKIKVEFDCIGEWAELKVSDTGSGIAPGQFDSLFDPFFTTKAQGGGLGLSIAQRIAQSHGGTLEADREASAGAIFILRLPVGGPLEKKPD